MGTGMKMKMVAVKRKKGAGKTVEKVAVYDPVTGKEEMLPKALVESYRGLGKTDEEILAEVRKATADAKRAV